MERYFLTRINLYGGEKIMKEIQLEMEMIMKLLHYMQNCMKLEYCRFVSHFCLSRFFLFPIDCIRI